MSLYIVDVPLLSLILYNDVAIYLYIHSFIYQFFLFTSSVRNQGGAKTCIEQTRSQLFTSRASILWIKLSRFTKQLKILTSAFDSRMSR